jgi:hypothetical protein
MVNQVEISSFDLRYESYRMKCQGAEKALVLSILQKGICYPLQGVDTKGARILLDGFKRLRCAKKLGLNMVPYSSMGQDEAHGIIELIRISNAKSLEIAALIDKSKGWVGMRLGMIAQMSACVIDKIFSGQFPAYAYMYSLRPFIRMNGVNQAEIDEFVSSVSGNHLSIRDIELLAYGYFRGSNDFRHQIKNGNLSWALNQLRQPVTGTIDCTQLERGLLRDLEITQKYMIRVSYKSKDKRLKNNSFFAQANLLAGGILRQIDTFSKTVKDLYDRSGQT